MIYQIYPRSFQDTNGDGIGDLQGVAERLDHVASLGVDAIWVSPFMASPMKDFGYDISDYRAVDPIFGTIEDFDRLVARAHALGLKVLIDQVLSHTSDQHAWFRQSRSSRANERADWYVWSDPKPDGSPPNNWLSVFGGSSWQWDSSRRQYYLHNFLASQPDLNFHNDEVRKALLADVRFWLERGVDGFRLDTANFYFHDRELRDNPALELPEGVEDEKGRAQPYNFQDHINDKNRPENLNFLRELRAVLDEYDAIALGEIGDHMRGPELMGLYTSGGDKLHMCYAFDFLTGSLPNVESVRRTLNRFEAESSGGWPCWALSNHDTERHASRWARHLEDPDAVLRLAAAILLTLRGSVCIYQGEELGLTDTEIAYEDLVDPFGIAFWPDVKTRDGARTPMVWRAEALNAGFSHGRPWLPIPAEHQNRAVDRLEEDASSILNYYRRLIDVRRKSGALAKGDLSFVELGGNVLAFVRNDGAEQILCAFNLSEHSQDASLPEGHSPVPIEAALSGCEPFENRLSFSPYGVFIGHLKGDAV